MFGHSLWYSTAPDSDTDMWLWCVRCKDPATIKDKVIWHPTTDAAVGWVDRGELERLIGFLRGAASAR